MIAGLLRRLGSSRCARDQRRYGLVHRPSRRRGRGLAVQLATVVGTSALCGADHSDGEGYGRAGDGQHLHRRVKCP